jgi:hypothetical protein
MGLVTAIPTKRNSVVSCEMSERLLKTLQKSGDFQADYTPAVISNGYHQRMSVSVVASPSNGLRA